jgi:signal peptidase I
MRPTPWMQLVLRVYPRSWRERYEDEVLDLSSELQNERGVREGRVALGLLVNAPRAWLLRGRTWSRRRVLAGSTLVLAVIAVPLATLLVPATPAASSPIRVVSGAMAPALKFNETVEVTPLRGSDRLAPGQIVVFRYPPKLSCGGAAAKFLVKRVIGTPGQTISLSHRDVFINGRKLEEPWLAASERNVTWPGPSGRPYSLHRPYRIPRDSYYVLGDNRTDSCDSRYFGPVSRSLVYGVVASSR